MPSFKPASPDELVLWNGRSLKKLEARLKVLETKLKSQKSPSESGRNNTFVFSVNGSGANWKRGRLVGLGEPVIKPGDVAGDAAYEFQNVFLSTTTDATTERFGITASGTPSNFRGKLILRGIANAIVNVTDVTHKYAKPSAIDGRLESTADATAVELLYAPAVGSDQVCKVILGNCCGTDAGGDECCKECEPGIYSNTIHKYTLTEDWDIGATINVVINGVTKAVKNKTLVDFKSGEAVLLFVTNDCEIEVGDHAYDPDGGGGGPTVGDCQFGSVSLTPQNGNQSLGVNSPGSLDIVSSYDKTVINDGDSLTLTCTITNNTLVASDWDIPGPEAYTNTAIWTLQASNPIEGSTATLAAGAQQVFTATWQYNAGSITAPDVIDEPTCRIASPGLRGIFQTDIDWGSHAIITNGIHN